MFIKVEIEKYFLAEKMESLIFLVVGLLCIVASYLFYFVHKTPIYKGAAIPVLCIALLFVIVGSTIYIRSPKDIVRVTALLPNKQQLLQEELPRMQKVMKSFVLYRYVEIAFVIIGILLFFVCTEKLFWKGFGIGLAVMGSFGLVADYFAEQRGHIYIKQLQNYCTN